MLTSARKNISYSTKREYIRTEEYIAHVYRSNRKKTISIKIQAGEVIILAPKKLSFTELVTLVNKKHHWIKQKITLQKNMPIGAKKQFITGETFQYLGKPIQLKVIQGKKEAIIFHDSCVTITSRNINKIRDSLIDWYKSQAIEYFLDKVNYFAKLIGQKPTAIKIKNYRRRWGCCKHNKELVFNWKLIMAPEPIIDYVIVHELCHLIHFNHSPKFWQAVEKIIPRYRESNQWLKDNALILEI